MILNLTQHKATPEQVESGVFNVSDRDKGLLTTLLTFEDLSDVIGDTDNGLSRLEDRAHSLARLAAEYCVEEGKIIHAEVMIGGAPFLMSVLERELREWGLLPVYAFSRREVVEKMQADGTVVKSAVFKHKGFVMV